MLAFFTCPGGLPKVRGLLDHPVGRFKWYCLLVAALTCYLDSPEARCLIQGHGVNVEWGKGRNDLSAYEMGWTFPWRCHRHLTLDGIVKFGIWRDGNDLTHEIYSLGVMPLLRFSPLKSCYRNPCLFFEAGAGVHLLSDSDVSNRHLGTEFQFGELVGMGFTIGVQQRWRLIMRLHHLSNASIDQPNMGINYFLLDLEYLFKRVP